jgi:type II secretory pathway component PulF
LLFGDRLLREKTAAFRQLATMLAAGMTLAEALSVLSARVHEPRLRAFFVRAARQASGGRRFSDILAEYPQLFPPLNLAMVQAAEHSGRIEEIFNRLADYHEQEYRVRLMLSRETFYPKVLAAAIFIIPVAGNAIVRWLTEGTGAAIISILRALALLALVGGIPALALYLAYRSLARSEAGRAALDDVKLRLPLLGKVVHRSAMARFSRALATLYRAGVAMDKSLELAGDAAANARFRVVAREAAGLVRHGSSLGDALVAAGLADEMVLGMVRTGEQTGNLDETMDHIAAYYEDEAATATRQMAVAIVPVAVIVAAIVVGVMVLRFYTGLYAGLDGQ